MTTVRIPLAIACGVGLALSACRSGAATDQQEEGDEDGQS
jgi:hypothetical protein